MSVVSVLEFSNDSKTAVFVKRSTGSKLRKRRYCWKGLWPLQPWHSWSSPTGDVKNNVLSGDASAIFETPSSAWRQRGHSARGRHACLSSPSSLCRPVCELHALQTKLPGGPSCYTWRGRRWWLLPCGFGRHALPFADPRTLQMGKTSPGHVLVLGFGSLKDQGISSLCLWLWSPCPSCAPPVDMIWLSVGRLWHRLVPILSMQSLVFIDVVSIPYMLCLFMQPSFSPSL